MSFIFVFSVVLADRCASAWGFQRVVVSFAHVSLLPGVFGRGSLVVLGGLARGRVVPLCRRLPATAQGLHR